MLAKLIFLCFLCLIVLACAQNQAANSDLFGKLSDHYRNKCYSLTKNENVYNKLSSDTSQFFSYLQYTFTLIPENGRNFCSNERKTLNLRFGEVTKDLEPCLFPEEKYLSEFLGTSFKEFTHFLCHNDREHMKSMFRDTECRDKLGDKFVSDLSTCFGRMFKPKSYYITKEELCSDISVAEQCSGFVLKDVCPNSHVYHHLSKTFFQYISKPCSGCMSKVNVLLLIFSVVASYFFNKK